MSYPSYPNYKSSHVEWLKEVPKHWSLKPLWALFRRVKDTGHPHEELLSVYREFGVIPKSSRDDNYNKPSEDLSGYQLVQNGDLAINKMKAWQGSVAISEYRGIVSPAYYVYRRQHNERSRFLHHLFRSKEYTSAYLSRSKGIRVNQWDLDPQEHSRMDVLLPPLEEQTQIARFLDHQTAHIDALIAEQQRLIELLKEKRQAVISHAVTKGLDPDVAMKDSGVEWLGEVPAHWGIKKLKYLTLKFEQGWSPQCENSPVQDSSEAGVLKVGCVNNGRFRQEENKRLPSELGLDPELTVKAGDLLVSRANTRDLVGSAATPTVDYPNLIISDKLFRLTLDQDSAIPFFFACFLNTPFARRKIEPEATGTSSSMLNIGQSTIREMHVPCPPIKEQMSIRDEIVNRTWELMALTERALGLVDLLHERRSALISAAVTGKIDVRDWQPPSSETFPDSSVREGVPA